MSRGASPWGSGLPRVRIVPPPPSGWPYWWPGTPSCAAWELAVALRSMGVPLVPAEAPDSPADIELSFHPEGCFSDASGRLKVVVDTHAMVMQASGVWHECACAARFRKVNDQRSYLATPLPMPGSASRAPGRHLLAVQAPWTGVPFEVLDTLAERFRDVPIVIVAPMAFPLSLPGEVHVVHPESPRALWSLLEAAVAVVVGDLDGQSRVPAGLVVASQLLGVPVVGWTSCAGGVLPSLIEESVTGFVASQEDIVPLVRAAAALDLTRVAARAAGRLDVGWSIVQRLEAWARIAAVS